MEEKEKKIRIAKSASGCSVAAAADQMICCLPHAGPPDNIIIMPLQMWITELCLLILLLFLDGVFLSLSVIDQNGYIVYCPCMGRFGNQAEQLLGTLQFGRAVNRTIVLPPFIQYVDRDVKFIPFTDLIDIDPIREYHSVITLEEFTNAVSPLIWKEDERRIFCYSKRPGSGKEPDCNAMDGNPYGPFWKHAAGVQSFAHSVFYSPLTTSYLYASDWINKYRKFPVIAFVGAPSTFPANAEAIKLQKYIRFSALAKQKAEKYRKIRKFPSGPYIGAHLRYGSDWKNACKLLIEHPMTELFSSQQCFNASAPLPHEICFHSMTQLVFDILNVIEHSNMSVIYIATDTDDYDLWQRLYKKLEHVRDLTLITPTKTYSSAHPAGYFTGRYPSIEEDLVILSEADHFIGNCISSFSAFVSRTRTWSGKDTSFFAKTRIPKQKADHDEL